MKKFLLSLLLGLFIATPVTLGADVEYFSTVASNVDCTDCVDATDIDLSDDYTWTGTHTFNTNVVTAGAGLTVSTGQNLLIGTTQWNSGDSIDGTKVADADLGDIDVSSGVWAVENDSHAHTNSTITLASTDLSDTADLLYETELDAFSELQAQIADKTLVNEEDATTFDATFVANGGAVFNDGSADVDFRIESNGEADMFKVDAGNNRVLVYAVSGANSYPFIVYNDTDTAIFSAYVNNTSTDEIAINEGSVDVDFRVESDTDANALFLDASAETLSIGVDTTITDSTADLVLTASGTSNEDATILMQADASANANDDWSIVNDGASHDLLFQNDQNAGTLETRFEMRREGEFLISGYEGNNAWITLQADEGDNNGDTWQIFAGHSNSDLTFYNDTSGSQVLKFTFTESGVFKPAGGYESSDGTAGATTTCADGTSLTVKNGLITACS